MHEIFGFFLDSSIISLKSGRYDYKTYFLLKRNIKTRKWSLNRNETQNIGFKGILQHFEVKGLLQYFGLGRGSPTFDLSRIF